MFPKKIETGLYVELKEKLNIYKNIWIQDNDKTLPSILKTKLDTESNNAVVYSPSKNSQNIIVI